MRPWNNGKAGYMITAAMKSSFCFTLALLAVAAGALAFRLPGLNNRPMHVDEAVQAVKFGELYEKGGIAMTLTNTTAPR